MKKKSIVLLVGCLVLALSACQSESPKVETSSEPAVVMEEKVETKKDIEYFKNAFDEKYGIKDIDEPAYSMIYADAGVLFYVDLDVVKIYQYSDAEKYEKAKADFPFVAELAKNGDFVIESSSDEYIEFFKGIK